MKEHAISLIREIDAKVERIPWTNEEIDARFAKRSGERILSDGNTCYMNPCLDLTLATATLLTRNKTKYRLVIEEHAKTERTPFNNLHFVLEFWQDMLKCFINYKTLNHVQIGRGDYLGRLDLPQVQLFGVAGDRISPSIPLHESLGFATIELALGTLFHGYNLKPHLSKLKQDNTPERFAEYQKVVNGGLQIQFV